jgi:hypothetical protein
MMLEVLTPCVQHGDDADFGTEVPAIGGNGGWECPSFFLLSYVALWKKYDRHQCAVLRDIP